MTWRPVYLLHARARCCAFGTGIDPHRRFISSSHALHFPNPTIASILARPRLGDDQEYQRITVAASVRTVRNQKLRSFVELGDGSTVESLQAVLEPHHAKGLTTGTSVLVGGLWQRSPPNKEQQHELKADEVTIIGPADAETYPIQKKYHSPEYLRNIPHLRLRTPFNALLARLRSECDFFLASFFRDLEFVRLQPPIITSSDCEGAGEVFTVSAHPSTPVSGTPIGSTVQESFFRAPKFLTVSSQLHLEAFVHEHQKVWSLSPTFRAEKSDTPRHLAEFWMLEAEIQTGSLTDVMNLVERMIRSLTAHLQKSKLKDELISSKRPSIHDPASSSASIADLIHRRWNGLIEFPWPRIAYSEIMQRLQSAVESSQTSFTHAPKWGQGLQLEHERFIVAEVGQGRPVFVTGYPTHIKPFYVLPSDTIGLQETGECFDLLVPDVCEIVGGSLREHRFEHLRKSMFNHGFMKSHQLELPKADEGKSQPGSDERGSLEWYLDLRRFGSVPHGGFGLGFDRLISYLAGVHNVKDVVAWPRWHERCDC